MPMIKAIEYHKFKNIYKSMGEYGTIKWIKGVSRIYGFQEILVVHEGKLLTINEALKLVKKELGEE